MTYYKEAFSGLSKEIWLLSLIFLVNRAGMMVLPFLSIYLTTALDFSISDTANIMMCFGLGSMVGSYIGGKLTDRIGYYKTMGIALIMSAPAYFMLQFPTDFWSFGIGVFISTLFADMFRPAAFVAMGAYAKPENQTRSITLVRLAINLGMGAGPAIGGLLIAGFGFASIFWVDAITALTAGILLFKVLSPKKLKQKEIEKIESPISPWSDTPFLLMITVTALFGLVFTQYFSSVPLFYNQSYGLSELDIGLLLGLNGIIIFLFEMPLIKFLEEFGKSMINYMLFALVLLALSFIMLLVPHSIAWLVIGIVLMTLSEMIIFPYSNNFTIERSKAGNRGDFMGLYSLTFALTHIFSHKGSMDLIHATSFEFTWTVLIGIVLLSMLMLLWLSNRLKEEKE